MSELPDTAVDLSVVEAVEAPLEPVNPYPPVETAEEFVDAFLAGKNASYEGFIADTGMMLSGSNDNIVALADHGGVILANSGATTDIQDALLLKAGEYGMLFARGHNPAGATSRLDEFKTLTKAARVAVKVFDIPVDIDAYVALAAERDRIANEMKAVEEAFITAPRFNAISELLVLRAAERNASRFAKSNALWDAGDRNVLAETARGADGTFQRLRIHPSDENAVQGSGGYTLALGRFRKGFNLMAPYVWGQGEKHSSRSLGRLDNNSFDLYATYVNVGCQTIAIAEIERFAKTLGYPLDGSKAES